MYDSAPESDVLLCLKTHSSVLMYLALFFQLISVTILSYFSLSTEIRNQEFFWAALACKVCALSCTMYTCGVLVETRGWKVSYTRKIIHVVFFISPVIDMFLPVPNDASWLWASWNLHIVIWILLAMTKPMRRNFQFIQTMYSANHRPEDRGLTQTYAFFQVILSILIISIFFVVFDTLSVARLSLIPIFSVALGDGMAEAVAQFCDDFEIFGGTHRYETTACCSGGRKFTRSLEGSLTVFIGTAISVAILHDQLSKNQLIYLFSSLPVTMTVLEAFAPHSLDNPILLLWGYFVTACSVFI